MPLTTTIGAFSKQALGLSAGINGKGWITVGSTSLQIDQVFGVLVDSNNNVYFPSTDQEQTAGGAQDQALLTKLNSEGIVSFNKVLQNRVTPTPALDSSFYSSSIDSLNNVVAIGKALNPTTSQVSAIAARYNSSGNLLWQKYLGSNTDAIDVACTSDGNSYISGFTQSNQIYSGIIIKLNSSGTVQWSKSITEPNSGQYIPRSVRSVTVDSAGDVYAFYQDAIVGSYIFKFSSNGTFVWQKKISNTTTFPDTFALSCDGNYVCAVYDSGYYVFNSSGTILRQKQITGDGIVKGAVFDSSGNIYITKEISLAGASKTIVMGISQTDQLLFANQISVDNREMNPRGIAFKNNFLYVTTFASPGSTLETWVFKLPGSGAIPKRGVYAIVYLTNTYLCRYSNSSQTLSTGSISLTTSTLIFTSPTIAVTSSTLTDTSSVWNAVTKPI